MLGDSRCGNDGAEKHGRQQASKWNLFDAQVWLIIIDSEMRIKQMK